MMNKGCAAVIVGAIGLAGSCPVLAGPWMMAQGESSIGINVVYTNFD
jgi:hypothetical protein